MVIIKGMGIQRLVHKSIKKAGNKNLKMGGRFVFLIVFLFSSLSFANTSKLEKAKDLYLKAQYSKANAVLNQISLRDLDPRRMALVHVFRGIVSYERKMYRQALEDLAASIKLGTRLRDVSHYYRGMSYLAQGDLKNADNEFQLVEEWEASDYLSEKAKYQSVKIAIKNGQRSEALTTLKKLERKMRRSEHYPEILFSLLQLNLNGSKKGNKKSCHWAKKLYRNHPTYQSIKSWGLKWSENKVKGKTLWCKDDTSDRKARLRRLQWSGASEKAFKELQTFEKSDEEKYVKDIMMAEYLVNEGHVNAAVEKLLPHYSVKKKDFKYTMLLAKAAARAGEFQTAIGVYTDASKVFRGSKSRTSLFRAAFLSYQFQDYDGALRRFEELKFKHPNSSLTRQANWYIPWLYYLKGNFQKSHDLFFWALESKRRRVPRRISEDQLKYWMAMSKLKMGFKSEAEMLFSEIARDDFIGYYSVASVQRLKELSAGRALAFVEDEKSITVHENWIPHNAAKDKQPPVDFANLVLQKTNQSFFEEWENLPFMQEYLELDNPATIFSQVAEPELRSHIERAKDMALIGQNELAKWELFSIETRTKNQDYQKTLMFEYHRNGIYHRSSYIGSRHFAGLRTHLGLHLGASLWQFVYPRAFEKDVITSAKSFGVPAEFVWSIMKAETNFRPDAVSPVGAKGLMQIMPHTGRKIASLMGTSIQTDDLIKPHISIKFGTRYLSRVLKKFNHKIPLAAAAYNGGPHRVHAWLSQFGHLEMDEFIEHIPFLETRNYVKKVVRYYSVYNLLYNKNNAASSWLADLVDVRLEGSPPTRETWEVL